jgi:hypothetical protein
MRSSATLKTTLATLACLAAGAVAAAQTTTAPVAKPAPAPLRDGSHDFDPIVGTWKATLKRLVHPLSGSHEWIELEGTQVTEKIWDGRATLDEFTVHDAKTNTHIDGLTLRIYNPETHEWSIYWANAKKGALDWPPVVGHWENGRGEFYDQEMFEGRAIFVRYVWSDVTPTSAHFEQSFSDDGGKTWEANWISTITREKPR